jgi:uncharacterized membrane protein YtjA (UPF0391 family)
MRDTAQTPLGRPGYSSCADTSGSKHMLRYVIVLLPLLLLGGVVCAAAVAAALPAASEIIFLICLGLFVVALADGISEHGSTRAE